MASSKYFSHHHQTTFRARQRYVDHRTDRHVRVQSLPLDPDEDGEKEMEGYHRLMLANCSKYRQKTKIKPEHGGKDKSTNLFTWDNVASGCADSVQLNPKQEGRVKIVIRKRAVTHLLTVIVYGEFEKYDADKTHG